MNDLGVKEWEANSPSHVKIGEVMEVAFTHQSFHKALSDATSELFSSGAAGTSTFPLQDVWVVDRPSAIPASPRWPEKGQRVTGVQISKPSDAKGWVQELTAVTKTGQPHFYQLGKWVVWVQGAPDYYAYVYGKVSDDDDVRNFRVGGEAYAAMAQNTRMSDQDLSMGAASLLRSDDRSKFVDGYGAQWMVAMCVSESARNFKTWGCNLMLLDMVCRAQVKGGTLAWRQIIHHGLHPMCRGGSTAHPSETTSLEAGLVMRWLQLNKTDLGGTTGIDNSNNMTVGAFAYGVDHAAWAKRRDRQIAEQSLKNTLRKRFSNIEAPFSWERT